MPKIQSILRTGSEALRLVDDVEYLSAIGKIAGKYDEIVQHLGHFTSPEAIVDQIIDGELDDRFIEILDILGLSEELKSATDFIDTLQNFAGKNLTPYRNLVKPISAFDEGADPSSGITLTGSDAGLLSWSIISNSKKLSAGQKDQYSLNMGADAVFEFEAGDTWPYESDLLPDPLLRIGFKGSVQAGAKAEIPLNIGFIGGGLEAKAGIDCNYFYDTGTSNSAYALALAKRLPEIPNPFDFDDIWEAFGDPRYGLSGITLKYDTHIGFDVNIGLGKSFSFAKGVELGADLTVKVGVKRPGSFDLSMRAGKLGPNGGRTIITTLSRGNTNERTYGAGLGLVLDLSGIAPRIHSLLTDALGHWDRGLQKIQPFLSPGTWLRSNLEMQLSGVLDDLIKNKDLRQALSDDLQIALGVKSEDDSALKDWLQDEIIGRLDDVSMLATKKTANTGDQIASVIAGQLPSVLGTELQSLISTNIGGLLEQLNDRFDDMVKGIFANEDRSDIGRALKKLGDDTGKRVKNLNDLGARVEALLDRYDKIFRKLVDAAGDAARAKITASIEIEEKRIDNASYQFSGEFLERTDETRRIFSAMMKGNFQEAALVLSDQTNGFVLDAEKSQISRFKQRSSKLGYELILFGFGGSATELIDGSAEVSISADGHISVASEAVAQISKSPTGKERRTAKFVAANSILITRATADQPREETRMMDLGLQFKHEDDELRRSELSGLIQGLVDIDLLPETTIEKADSLLDEWVGKGKKSKIRADVDIKLILGREGMLNLMQIGAEDVDPTLDDKRLANISKCYEQASKLVEKFRSLDQSSKHIRKEVEEYAEMIRHMRSIYFSMPAGLIGKETTGNLGGWSVKEYQKIDRAIAKIAKKRIKHLKVTWTEGGFGQRVDHKFLLFMSMLVTLSRKQTSIVGNDEQLTPGTRAVEGKKQKSDWAIAMVITRKSKGHEPVTKVLV